MGNDQVPGWLFTRGEKRTRTEVPIAVKAVVLMALISAALIMWHYNSMLLPVVIICIGLVIGYFILSSKEELSRQISVALLLSVVLATSIIFFKAPHVLGATAYAVASILLSAYIRRSNPFSRVMKILVMACVISIDLALVLVPIPGGIVSIGPFVFVPIPGCIVSIGPFVFDGTYIRVVSIPAAFITLVLALVFIAAPRNARTMPHDAWQ